LSGGVTGQNKSTVTMQQQCCSLCPCLHHTHVIQRDRSICIDQRLSFAHVNVTQL